MAISHFLVGHAYIYEAREWLVSGDLLFGDRLRHSKVTKSPPEIRHLLLDIW